MNYKIFVWLIGIIMVMATIGSASAQLTNGLVAYYRFNQTSQTDNLTDYVGSNDVPFAQINQPNGHPVNQTGGIANIDPYNDFNSTTTTGSYYYRVAGASGLPTGDRTMEAWVNIHTFLDEGAVSQDMMIWKDYSVTSGQYFSIDSEPKLLQARVTDAGNDFVVLSTGVVADSWYHVVSVWNSTAKNLSLYINGTRVTSGVNALVGALDTNSEIEVAHSNPANKRYFNGNITQISIWNRTLNQTEITALYNGGAGVLLVGGAPPPAGAKFQITANNTYNLTTILNFNASINGVPYSTTNGTIWTGINRSDGTLHNISVYYNNYITRNYTNWNISTNLNTWLWQSVLTLKSYEIATNNSIANWSITTPYNTSTTTTNTITLYPNLGNYTTWTWNNSMQYFNVTLSNGIPITGTSHAYNLTGFYARNISFINALGVNMITPTCIQNGYTFNNVTLYYMPRSTNWMFCTLFGYIDKNFTSPMLNAMPDNSTYNMSPAMLWLIFDQNTSGFVETENCSESPQNCDNFTGQSVYIQQQNISVGDVVVKFNPNGTNWRQIYEYYNDGATHIREFIKIIVPDLSQSVKVTTGGGSPLDDARVIVQNMGINPDTNQSDWITVYSKFTNVDGLATVMLNDEDTYKFCAQKEGYVTECTIQYIVPLSTETILIDLEESTAPAGFNFIATSCPNIYYEDTNCTLTVNTYKPYNTIAFVYASATLNNTYQSSNSVQKILYYTLTNATTYVNITVLLNGNIEREIRHSYVNFNPDIEIAWDTPTNITGATLMDMIKGDATYQIVVYLILTVVGVLMGIMAEKYFNGYGLYGTGVWFLVLSLGQLYIFWIPTIVLGIYAIMYKLVPLFENK